VEEFDERVHMDRGAEDNRRRRFEQEEVRSCHVVVLGFIRPP